MRRRMRIIAITLLTMCAISLALFGMLPQDRLLLHRATPIAHTKMWVVGGRNVPALMPYYWLSNEEILYFAQTQNGSFQAFRQKVLPSGISASPIALPLGPVTTRWILSQVSPDSRQLLWLNNRSPLTTIMPTDLSGVSVAQWNAKGCESIQWMPDGRRVFAINKKSREALIFSPETAHPYRISLHSLLPSDLAYIWGFTPEGEGIGWYNPVVIKDTERQRKLVFLDFKRERPQASISVPEPAGLTGSISLPSPHGDRMLWAGRYAFVSPLAALLGRLIPGFQATAQTVQSLWVSDMDGNHMHEIGHVALDNDVYGIGVSWLPDGRHISFIYQDTLYTTSVD